MPTAQNGWPVVTSAPAFVVDGVSFPNGVLAGSAQVVFRWLVRQYDKRVENVRAGWCWGFDHKKISGSDDWSCHAAALAIDINAPAHPMGVEPSENMSQRQIDECHALERESDGVLRWGGDFSRPDPMHWEVVGNKSQLDKLATKILKEENVAITTQEKTDIANAAVDALKTRDNVFASPSWAESHDDNPYWNFAAVYGYAMEDTHASLEQLKLENALIKTQLATILSAISDLTPGA